VKRNLKILEMESQERTVADKKFQFWLLYGKTSNEKCNLVPVTFATYAFVLRIVLINVGNGDVRGVRGVVAGARLASLSSTIFHIQSLVATRKM
jgi:hypothetical protein